MTGDREGASRGREARQPSSAAPAAHTQDEPTLKVDFEALPELDVDAEVTKRYRRASFKPISQRQLSWRIFLTVAIFAGALALSLALFAAFTYPQLDEVAEHVPAGGDSVLEAWSQARADWAQQFASLAQMSLFGSVVPLMATIAGYAIGERRGQDENENG